MTFYNFVAPLSEDADREYGDGECYIAEGEIAAVKACRLGFYGTFRGSRIFLKGGGEIVVHNKPEEIIKLIKLES